MTSGSVLDISRFFETFFCIEKFKVNTENLLQENNTYSDALAGPIGPSSQFREVYSVLFPYES